MSYFDFLDWYYDFVEWYERRDPFPGDFVEGEEDPADSPDHPDHPDVHDYIQYLRNEIVALNSRYKHIRSN